MHANGRRLFRAAVRLPMPYARRSHESFSLSCSIRSFSAFNIQNQTSPGLYAASVLSSVCIRSSGCDCSPGFFISEEPPLLPAAFRLFFRRPPGVSPPPLSGYHSGSFWSPSRRRPVAAFLNLCRRFRDADIVRPRPFSGNPVARAKQVARQNRLPGRPFGFPAECSGQPVSRPAGAPTKSSSPNPDCCIPR